MPQCCVCWFSHMQTHTHTFLFIKQEHTYDTFECDQSGTVHKHRLFLLGPSWSLGEGGIVDYVSREQSLLSG